MRSVTLIFFLIVLFLSKPEIVFGQQLKDGNEIDRQNFMVVKEAVEFLLLRSQPKKLIKNTEAAPGSYRLYDTLLQKYYDVEYRRDSLLGLDTAMSQTAMQKILLFNIDIALDVFPVDSIMITPVSNEKGFQPGTPPARWILYTVSFIIGDRLHYRMLLVFTRKNKLVMVAPYLDFEKLNEGIDVEGFYKRHGYDKVKHLLYDFKCCPEKK